MTYLAPSLLKIITRTMTQRPDAFDQTLSRPYQVYLRIKLYYGRQNCFGIRVGKHIRTLQSLTEKRKTVVLTP